MMPPLEGRSNASRAARASGHPASAGCCSALCRVQVRVWVWEWVRVQVWVRVWVWV